MKAVNQFTKVLYPFRYEKSKVMPSAATVEGKGGKPLQLFESTSVKASNLRSGLELLLDEDGGSANVCRCYRISPNLRRHFKIPPRAKDLLTFCPRQEERSFSVAINDIRVFFFESMVGMVEIEFCYPQCTEEDFVAINYFLAEAKSDNNILKYTPFEWDPVKKERVEGSTESFTVAYLLDKIGRSVSVGGEQTLCYTYYNAKPLTYAHLLLPERPVDMEDLIYHAAKNYKYSYKLQDSGSVCSFSPFANSTWGATLNGAANVSFLTGDPITDKFFTEDFFAKLHSTYYHLFLNVVHQRLLIERIMAKMGELDYLGKNYVRMKEQLSAAKECSEEAARLKFRAFFDMPSTVDHVNGYYDALRDAFGIARLYENFESDINNLSAICSAYVDRIKERDKKIEKLRRSYIEIFVSIFGTLVGEVALLNSSWELLEKLLGREVGLFSVQMIAVLGALIVPVVTVIVNTFYQAKEIRTLKRDILDERRNHLVEDDRIRRIRARIKKKK